VNHPVFLQAYADPVIFPRSTNVVVECDAAAVVIARKGNCSDMREGAGSHIPCTFMIDETGNRETSARSNALREVFEKLRRRAESLDCRVSSFELVSVELESVRDKMCSEPELNLVG
jgi:hypothetical protein